MKKRQRKAGSDAALRASVEHECVVLACRECTKADREWTRGRARQELTPKTAAALRLGFRSLRSLPAFGLRIENSGA